MQYFEWFASTWTTRILNLTHHGLWGTSRFVGVKYCTFCLILPKNLQSFRKCILKLLHKHITDEKELLTFPTYSGSVPVYSSTTKNWFHTHPLLTRSRDEGPWSSFLPPEVGLLVLEASQYPKLHRLRSPSAANSVQTPAVQEGAILRTKLRLKSNKRQNVSQDWHVKLGMYEKTGRFRERLVYKKQIQA